MARRNGVRRLEKGHERAANRWALRSHSRCVEAKIPNEEQRITDTSIAKSLNKRDLILIFRVADQPSQAT